jgi:hypothetical protein
MLLGEPLDALILRRADAQAALDQFGHNGSSLGEAWSGYRKAMFNLLPGLAQAGGLPQVECRMKGYSAYGIIIQIHIKVLFEEILDIGRHRPAHCRYSADGIRSFPIPDVEYSENIIAFK